MSVSILNIIDVLEKLAVEHGVIYFRSEDYADEGPEFAPDTELIPTLANLTKLIKLAAAQAQPIFVEEILPSDELAAYAVIDRHDRDIEELIFLFTPEQLTLFEQRIEALNQNIHMGSSHQPIQISVYLCLPQLTLQMKVDSDSMLEVAKQLDTKTRAWHVAGEILGETIDEDRILEAHEQIRLSILEKFHYYLLQEPSFARCTNKRMRRQAVYENRPSLWKQFQQAQLTSSELRFTAELSLIGGYPVMHTAEEVWRELKEQKTRK